MLKKFKKYLQREKLSFYKRTKRFRCGFVDHRTDKPDLTIRPTGRNKDHNIDQPFWYIETYQDERETNHT